MQKHTAQRVLTVLMLAAVAVLGLSVSAQAKLTGNFVKFGNCPYTNEELNKCIYDVTESGEVVLGSKKVPIVNPVVLQGGYGEGIEEKEGAEFAKFYGATNGETLAKTPQPVPGGLAGLINCKEIGNLLLRVGCEAALENGVTGVNATLELARPASEIRVSENNLAGEVGTALYMPVKVHLENPFLGSSCYVGSSSSPIIWKLTSGTTNPPAPNKPISGTPGEITFLNEGRIAEAKNNRLVDNAWSAPGASGCGGPIVELLLDPVVNVSASLPAAAGVNTAILKGTLNVASALAVLHNDQENP
jgi:hypothetical protein